MKQSNKWILGVAVAVFAATVPYQIIAQKAIVKPAVFASIQASNDSNRSGRFWVGNNTAVQLKRKVVGGNWDWSGVGETIPALTSLQRNHLTTGSSSSATIQYSYCRAGGACNVLCAYTVERGNMSQGMVFKITATKGMSVAVCGTDGGFVVNMGSTTCL